MSAIYAESAHILIFERAKFHKEECGMEEDWVPAEWDKDAVQIDQTLKSWYVLGAKFTTILFFSQ